MFSFDGFYLYDNRYEESAKLKKINNFQVGDDVDLTVNWGQGGFCIINVNETVLLFGGHFTGKQILQVYAWGVKRIGTLEFEFSDGRCRNNNGTIYLCFSPGAQKTCHTR